MMRKKKLKSWAQVLIGLFVGAIVGLIMGQKAVMFAILGKIFIGLLSMIVALIVFASLITGICHIKDPKKLGRVSFRTVSFFLITTLIAICIGVALSMVIQPGSGLEALTKGGSGVITPPKTFTQFILDLIPSNPVNAFATGSIMQIIIFSIFIGIAIIFAKEKGDPVLRFVDSLASVMRALTHIVMLTAPIGVFGLMAATFGQIGWRAIVPLLKYLLTNYIACACQIFIIFSLVLKVLSKVDIIPFFKGMKEAVVLAFTTCSSAVTLPVNLECSQKHLGVSKDIAGFVLSLSTTINLNGCAIGQVIAATFVAQAYGVHLTVLHIIILIFAALFAAAGAAGMPGAGIAMMSVVCTAIGVPIEGVGLIVGVDRLREMVSTVTNVMGGAVATVYVAKKEHELDEKTYHEATWLKTDI
jgi:Na+/H+-dicarboxylate symporter